MGTYKPKKTPTVLTAAWINTELLAIATAHNSHSPENFSQKCVSLWSLKNKYARWVQVIQSYENTSSSFDLLWSPPVACNIESISIICVASTYSDQYTLKKFDLDNVDTDIATGYLDVSADPIIQGVDVDIVPGETLRIDILPDSAPVKFVTIALSLKAPLVG